MIKAQVKAYQGKAKGFYRYCTIMLDSFVNIIHQAIEN